ASSTRYGGGRGGGGGTLARGGAPPAAAPRASAPPPPRGGGGAPGPGGGLPPRRRSNRPGAGLRTGRRASAGRGGGLGGPRGPRAEVEKTDVAGCLWGDNANMGGGVAHPAVLVDEGDVAVAHHLPGERLGETLVDREHALLRERHRLLQRAVVRQRAEVGGEE